MLGGLAHPIIGRSTGIIGAFPFDSGGFTTANLVTAGTPCGSFGAAKSGGVGGGSFNPGYNDSFALGVTVGPGTTGSPGCDTNRAAPLTEFTLAFFAFIMPAGSSWQTVGTGVLSWSLASSDSFLFGGYPANANPSMIIINGAWHHYAVTISGTSVKFYRDGSEFETRTLTSTPSCTASSVFISLPANTTSRYDNIVIAEKALTPAEIALLAAGTMPSTGGNL
jgi:Concanavalin A-like lectin/glucanases superfamily